MNHVSEDHDKCLDRGLNDGHFRPNRWKSALESAKEEMHLSVVDSLFQDTTVDPSADNQWAIQWASQNGHLSVVTRLLLDSRVNPSAQNQYAIRWASGNGHLQVVDCLLRDERVDPSDGNRFAIEWASYNGHPHHVETMRFLLSDPRVKPTHLTE